jgi:hypothetical protein
MSDVNVQIHVDTSQVDNELDRLDHGLGFGDLLRLDSIVVGMFIQTQMDVHVQTGSLRASAKVNSHYEGMRWEGSIKYGGLAPGGIHNPVTYAEIEYLRGDEHNFMRSLRYPSTRHRYEDAILAYLRGGQKK